MKIDELSQFLVDHPRDGEIKVVNVKLEKLTTIDVPVIGTLKELSPSELKKRNSDYGLELQNLSEKYKTDWEEDGVYKGALVVSINNIKVNSIADVKSALSEYSNSVFQISVVKTNGEKLAYRFR